MSALPLQRSKELLQEQGFHVWIVEHYNQWSRRRMDLYNMADLVAIRHDRQGVTGIQCCSEDVHPHIQKLLFGYTDSKGKVWPKNGHLPVWLAAGNPFFIWAWRKRGDEGKHGTRKTWQLREVEFILKGSETVAQEIPTLGRATDFEG